MQQRAPTQPWISPHKADAIHRALLSGLLGNVGARGDAHEYTAPHGSKFSIFPGSALFKRSPSWVVSAELVETTRLYARTVAPIQPLWIEQVGDHLVKRLYSDPKWDRDRAQVVSVEKVSLYSLVVTPARRVHYGPIDPRTSREIFIERALVEGQFRSDAPFFRHNMELRAAVERMEGKLRRRGMLADVQHRFRSFDKRLPGDVYDGQTFDAWRRRAENRNRRLLFMSASDMLAPGAQPPSPELYPDELRLDGLVLPLDYVYDAANPADGVTAKIPLAALGQVPAAAMEWLVPGMLPEKIDALIRALPKELRKNFIPIGETAAEAARTLTFGDGSLREALALFLGKKAGIVIHKDAYGMDLLPPYLRMNFRIIDAAGKQIAMGRDLDEIRRELRVEVQSSFAKLPDSEHNRDNLTRWDFGDLPERVPVHRHGMTLWGYPALIDKGNFVSIRLLDSPEHARAARRAGARRLFMMQLRQEIQSLMRSIPKMDQMCLHYATVGPCAELKADLVSAIVDRAMFFDADDLRLQSEFIRRASEGWRRLTTTGSQISELAAQILAEFHALQRELEKAYPVLLHASVRDMRDQLAQLVYKDFLSATPHEWLKQLLRFLKGIAMRLRKVINAGLERDQQAMTKVLPLWEQYKEKAATFRRQGREDANLEQYRWMLEEYRVSLFAQELKASIPISAQRLEKVWESIQS